MLDGRLRVMLLLGTNMLSSYADAGRVAEALGRMDPVVAIAALAAEGGMRALRISHVGHPDGTFPTPSGKIEFESAVAAGLGLPSLPVAPEPPPPGRYPLTLCQGRTLTHFHGCYERVDVERAWS